MIRLTHVKKRFGEIEAVRGVSFHIPAGQIVGILGPNGAGKTTTIRMITAAIPPSEGQIEIDGLDAIDHSLEVRRRIGYLPEAAPLYREMRVASYLRFRAGLYGLRGPQASRAIQTVITRCDLGEVARRRTGVLSKGYRQRVGLAAALIHDPPLVILDEPTSGLDPTQIAETRRLIRGLAGERTMIIVSHILPEVEKSCDRIMLFARGRIAADGPPEKLIGALGSKQQLIIECYAADAAATSEPQRTIESIEGVRLISSQPLEPGWLRLMIESDQRDTREPIARACAAARIIIREIRPVGATLEDFYLRLIAEEANETGRGQASEGPRP